MPDMETPTTPAIQVAVATSQVRVIRNGVVSLDVTVSRSGGAIGDIALSAEDLPSGVTAGGVTIPDGMTTGTIELAGDASVELGTFATATVRATSGTLEAAQPIDLHITDAPGAIDLSFGFGGKTLDGYTPAHDEKVRFVATQADGRVIAIGEDDTSKMVFLARSGAFGLSKASVGYDFAATCATVAADGSIVLARFGSGSFDVVRVIPDGALDVGFDGDGKASATFGTGVSYPKAVTLRPDGRIVLAGSYQDGAYTSYAVAQLTGAGAMDTSFSDDGKWTLDLNKTTSFSGSAVLPDGRLAVLDPYSAKPQIFMFTPSGHLDLGFGTQGILESSLLSAKQLIAVDDGLLTLGYTGDTALEKRNLDGTLDVSFGTNGVAAINFGSGTEYPQSAALDMQGRVVVATFTSVGLELNQVGLARIWN